MFGGAAAIGNMPGGILADRLGTLAAATLGLAGMASALILHSLVLKWMPGQAHYAAIGGALGGAVLATLSPTDLGWIGGTSVAASLLVHLARGWQARPKPVKIAG